MDLVFGHVRKIRTFDWFCTIFGGNVRDVPNNGPKEDVQDPIYGLIRTKTPLFGRFGGIWRNLDFDLD